MPHRHTPWIVVALLLVFATTVSAAYNGGGIIDNTTGIADYVQEFGALSIVAAVVFWMMKRMDTLIKMLQQSVANSKVVEEAIASHNSLTVQTQRDIITELQKLRDCLDKHCST